ncbi:VOC family protein [Undibacterium sp.]|uniref:VOC family protein n=1 Tax=Undibacterium sp. TaxID=1914977 RepID=UPI0025DFF4CC|nr:VOC family protein [Undibacterium sp.]MCX7220095.1 VOC family protein [Burkholderiales bacterium]
MQVIELDHVQIAIPVGGEALAREFYAGILGMPELPKPVLMQLRGGAWFACGDRQIHLGAEVNFQPAKKAHPAFIVRDLDALCTLLRAAGYAVLKNEELPEVRRVFTEDPFGNRIELIQSKYVA